MRDRIRVNGLNIGWMDTPGEDRIQKRYHDAADGLAGQGRGAAALRPPGRPGRGGARRGLPRLGESGLMTGSIIDFDQSVMGCYESAPHPSNPAQ